jgi:hypothetical protein
VVDQHWGVSPRNAEPKNKGPQSYAARARSDPAWKITNADMFPGETVSSPLPRAIHGRVLWPSDPIAVTVSYAKAQNAGSGGDEYVVTAANIVSKVYSCAWWTRPEK